MKKLLKLFVTLCLPLLALASCSKDDNKGGEQPLLPVKNLVAQAGDAQVVLAWEAPKSNDYIKEYSVTWTPGSGNATVKSGTMFTAVGLTNGTEYTFSVFAVYESGKSVATTIKATPKSDAINYAPCTNFKATAGYQSIALNWTQPVANPQAVLTGYKVSVDPMDVQAVSIADPAAESYTIEGLTNGKEYTVTIVAMYEGGNFSTGATAKAKPSSLVTGASVEGAFVNFDEPNKKIDVYYNKPADLKNVKVTLELASGVPAGSITNPVTLDLSDGKTGTIKISDNLSYSVSASVDLLMTALTAKFDDLEATVAIDQAARTVSIDFGENEIDKKIIVVNMTLSDNATLVNPTANPATMNLSAATNIELKGKYQNTVSYAVTCKGVHTPLFDPAEITSKAIPADWTRIIKDTPKSMAVYKVSSYNGATVNAYVVMWGKSAAHTVYSDGTKKTFAEYKTMSEADAPAVLIAGDSAAKCFAFHGGNLLYYPAPYLDNLKPENTAPTFALDNDGKWTQHSAGCKTVDGKAVMTNFDAGSAVWNAKEAFGAGGFYLNPGAEGGFTPGGSDPISQCFFGVDAADNGKVAAFVVCSKTETEEGISQDDLCRLLLSVGIKCGFPICKKGVTGLYINGNEMIRSESATTMRFAVGIK